MLSYLERGHRPSFEEWKQFIDQQFGEIKTRQFRMDIQYLRETGLSNGPLNIRFKNGQYQLINEKKFDYGNLLQSEKVTLPLVFAALKPFERFPSVRALLDQLIKVHKLNRQEIKILGASLGNNQPPMNELFVDRIITLMQAIHQETAVEFNYYKVDQGAITSENNNIVFRAVFPLQIRVHDGRYYLVGLRTEREARPELVEHFPIDRIHRRVDFSTHEDTEEPVKFSWPNLANQLNLEELFAHRIGMYRGSTEEKPVWIYRWFTGWAASFVQAVPLHSSQEIIETRGGDIRIRLTLVPTQILKIPSENSGSFRGKASYSK
jgi:predicted DNA-binding transcriptional regulator YafY